MPDINVNVNDQQNVINASAGIYPTLLVNVDHEENTVSVTVEKQTPLVDVQVIATGPVGPGVAAGGAAGQVLRKASGTNYDTEWTDDVSSVNGQTGDVALSIPSAVSELTNDSGYVDAAGASAAAPVQSVNGQTGAVTVTVPTKVSDLTNDSGFVDSAGAALSAPVQSVNAYTGDVVLTHSDVNALPDDISIAKGTHSSGTSVIIGKLDDQTASGNYSVAIGRENVVSAGGDVAFGRNNNVSASFSFASGYGNVVQKVQNSNSQCAAAIGDGNIVDGYTAFAEGYYNQALKQCAHAEGQSTIANANQAHSEGFGTTASGYNAHAENDRTIASGVDSHAEGLGTIANHQCQHVFGRRNIPDPSAEASTTYGNYVEIVGNGQNENELSNARTLDWSGNETLAGTLTLGADPVNNMDAATKQYVDSVAGGGAVDSVNGYTGTVILDADDVGALPDTTPIPSKTSDLVNDSGFITGYTETDPVFSASAAAGITSSDISTWNGKSDFSGSYNDLTDKPSIPSPQTSGTPADLGTAARGSATTYSRSDHVHNKPTYTKSDVGLGNVDNVQQYSASNPPPYPVTSVNGNTGAVTVSVPTKVSDLSNDSGFVDAAGAAAAAPVQSVNGNTGAVTLSIPSTASDVGALPDTTKYALSASVGGPATVANGIHYAQVDNTSTATKFTATIPGITSYYDGLTILLKNGVVTSASGFTININNLGAKQAYSNMAAATAETTLFNINYTMLFVYDSTRVTGGGWICYRGYDANTNTIGYQIRTNSFSVPMTSITYRYRLLFQSADKKRWVPANNSTSTNATTARSVCQDPINPLGPIVYYGTTASVAAGSRPSAANLWQEYTFNLGYSFQKSPNYSLTEWKPVYLKCAPQSDGSAIIDSTTPFVQDLPTTEDGKLYILLGFAYSTTSMELVYYHPVYWYKGGRIRHYTDEAPELPAVTSADNGKFLTVVNGAWAAATIPNANGVSF